VTLADLPIAAALLDAADLVLAVNPAFAGQIVRPLSRWRAARSAMS